MAPSCRVSFQLCCCAALLLPTVGKLGIQGDLSSRPNARRQALQRKRRPKGVPEQMAEVPARVARASRCPPPLDLVHLEASFAPLCPAALRRAGRRRRRPSARSRAAELRRRHAPTARPFQLERVTQGMSRSSRPRASSMASTSPGKRPGSCCLRPGRSLSRGVQSNGQRARLRELQSPCAIGLLPVTWELEGPGSARQRPSRPKAERCGGRQACGRPGSAPRPAGLEAETVASARAGYCGCSM